MISALLATMASGSKGGNGMGPGMVAQAHSARAGKS